MASKEFFEIPKRYKNWSIGLVTIGIVSVIVGFLMYGNSEDVHQKTRFWAALVQNSVYFLMVVNACMFFLCASTLAYAGWHLSFSRVAAAIGAAVPVVGGIAVVILLTVLYAGHHLTEIYHWTDAEAVAKDPILKGKTPFLNIPFFTIWTILTVGLWSLLGYRMRRLSLETDRSVMDIEQKKKYTWKSTVWSALYIVWFALTIMSTTPWLWLMSIDAHWYSTMYSWYTFASTWVAGLALLMVFVVYLKNMGYLEYTNREHIHDIGKFIFAFSIFWAYLWFAQFMLIWYANIPEETVYYKTRLDGTYSGVFWFMFIINFVAPLLIFMTRRSKRNYATVTMMSLVILFGHWLDFHQMIFGSVAADKVVLNLFDFGVAAGFVGIIMLVVGRVLSKHPMVPKNHPFLKESIIHHT